MTNTPDRLVRASAWMLMCFAAASARPAGAAAMVAPPMPTPPGALVAADGLSPAGLLPTVAAVAPLPPAGSRPIVGYFGGIYYVEGDPILPPPPSPGECNVIWPVGFHLIPVSGPGDGGPPALAPPAAASINTPEPSSLALYAVAVAVVLFSRRARRRPVTA